MEYGVEFVHCTMIVVVASMFDEIVDEEDPKSRVVLDTLHEARIVALSVPVRVLTPLGYVAGLIAEQTSPDPDLT